MKPDNLPEPPYKTKIDEAKDAIMTRLQQGPIWTNALISELAELGHSPTTLKIARKQLHIDGKIVIKRYGSTRNPYTAHLPVEEG